MKSDQDPEEHKMGEQDSSLPPVSYHVTDSYVTAIIGGPKPDEEAPPEGLKGFWELIPGAQKDAILKEQLIDALKTDVQSVDFLVSAIQDVDNLDYRAFLLMLCWETGLDMSKHLDYFTGLAAVVTNPLEMLELQTIIQEINPADDKRKAAHALLRNAMESKTDPVVKEIMADLVYFLES